MEAVLVRPSRGGEAVVGEAFVSIGKQYSQSLVKDMANEVGREDAVRAGTDPEKCSSLSKEVRTTGWVIVRFIPRPTGIRYVPLNQSRW